MKRPARVPSQLSKSLHQRVNAYALAAGAVGVGVLALTMPAEGKIIYTPAHLICGFGGTAGCAWSMIHGGKKTFVIGVGTSATSNRHDTGMSVAPFDYKTSSQKINGIAGKVSDFRPRAYALRAGTPINGKLFPASLSFAGMAEASQHNGKSYFRDPWANNGKGVKNRYLGLRFAINGKVHYGWARLNVSVSNGIYATLTGYAYETIPNKPIIAGATKGPDEAEPTASLNTPEPATLGALAMGAPGLSIWRRKESGELRSSN